MKARTSHRRNAAMAAALIGIGLSLGACVHDEQVATTLPIPADYRQRHPIAIEEAKASIVVFVGQGRGGLSAEQRADVLNLAQTWSHEGTGAIDADVPVDTPNARAAADPRHLPPIRLSYPRMKAVAGPCGLWPDDLGPSVKNKNYYDNTDYYNFGCAYQRNMAAMVDNPSDLVQPRPETAPYTARRSEAFDKYRKGTTTATDYPESNKAKLSDTGK